MKVKIWQLEKDTVPLVFDDVIDFSVDRSISMKSSSVRNVTLGFGNNQGGFHFPVVHRIQITEIPENEAGVEALDICGFTTMEIKA